MRRGQNRRVSYLMAAAKEEIGGAESGLLVKGQLGMLGSGRGELKIGAAK